MTVVVVIVDVVDDAVGGELGVEMRRRKTLDAGIDGRIRLQMPSQVRVVLGVHAQSAIRRHPLFSLGHGLW